MKYARTTHGKMWHMLVDGKILCGSSLKPTVESESPPHVDICQNCDGELRERGKVRAAKISTGKIAAPSKADYFPRHHFKE